MKHKGSKQKLARLLDSSIKESPSLSIKERNIIKEGYNANVDELRQLKLHCKEWIATLNNTTLNQSDKQLLAIIYINTTDKSKYIRQVALITLIAQKGSIER